MGRHVNAEAGSDESPSTAPEEGTGSADPQHEHARHIAESAHPLEPQAVISPDTHVGVEFGAVTGAPDAEAPPANPDALIEHGQVGDGHEME
ncbi:MAG TPA: hypothetical protein VFQ74_03800 [Pseudolysinimonas sp.]|nr:hypothetical protein [Pseudolysinimonas sp.]